MFWTTRIISDKRNSPVNQGADLLLWPARYLLGGRTVVVHTLYCDQTQSKTTQLVKTIPSERSWWKCALAIACLIPGLLLGTLAKALAFAVTPHLRDVLLNEYEEVDACTSVKRVFVATDLGEDSYANIYISNILRHRYPKAEFKVNKGFSDDGAERFRLTDGCDYDKDADKVVVLDVYRGDNHHKYIQSSPLFNRIIEDGNSERVWLGYYVGAPGNAPLLAPYDDIEGLEHPITVYNLNRSDSRLCEQAPPS